VQEGSLIPRFGRARRDPALAVLEGFHPLKHALRFRARIELALTYDPAKLRDLATTLAPDVSEQMLSLAQPVKRDVFEQLAPLAPSTPVIALALRPPCNPAALLARDARAPVVLLEDPRDLGNMGACVRAAAAADAAGVLTTGTHDPWHPDALRGAAGLHFALPVCRIGDLDVLFESSAVSGGSAISSASAVSSGSARPLLAVAPDGEPLDPARLDPRAVLAVGTERYGLSDALSERAQGRISIPMREGVSSLNLATSVAAVLFAWRLCASARAGT
jgi:TrmH family RNA methyltransferase